MPAIPALDLRAFDPGLPSVHFRGQWKNPSDVFSVLLILGGDVVARALAQLVGSRVTPVAFSFGWVAYAVAAVVGAVGDNKLMPVADCSCRVINGKTGFVRDNSSWIIGRIVRDFETWMDKKIQERLEKILEEKCKKEGDAGKTDGKPKTRKAGLCVSIYEAKEARLGYPGYDRPYYTGFITCIVQLGLAAIPCGLFGDWSILMITVAGIVLSFVSGAIPQWSQEKWACRYNTKKTVVLTKGNGSQHAIVIKGEGRGLDLEDLAAADAGSLPRPSGKTRLCIVALAALWVLLLITASGIQQNTWFLLAVGAVGILQNVYVAGACRSPEAFGIPLEFKEVFVDIKVMKTLYEVEKAHPRLGKSMLGTFFPGELREDEKAEWERYAEIAKEKGI